MVDFASALIGAVALIAVVVIAASYLAAYKSGQQKVSESAHYVNMRDVETYRANSVRDEELRNTEASVQDERPVPQIGDE